MKTALIQIATITQKTWVGLTNAAMAALNAGNAHINFPTIVAHTTEGEVMDGPRGLRLITACGTTPVYQTPEGYMVCYPVPHILQATA